jgi:DNA mismatch repair protein MutH
LIFSIKKDWNEKPDRRERPNHKGKGNFGQILEKFYFDYEPNSDAEPDFKEAGLELKSSPLKILKNGEFRSKERLVLNIINYLEVHKEEFETSSFWKKNAHLLLVFYLHDKELDLLDYLIKLVDGWQYPSEDLIIIKQDWEFIKQKIIDGESSRVIRRRYILSWSLHQRVNGLKVL